MSDTGEQDRSRTAPPGSRPPVGDSAHTDAAPPSGETVLPSGETVPSRPEPPADQPPSPQPPDPPATWYAPPPADAFGANAPDAGRYAAPSGGYAAPVSRLPLPPAGYPPPYPPPAGAYPPPAYAPPVHPGYPRYPAQRSGSWGAAIASLVLGLVCLLLCWLPFVGIVTGMVGVAAVVLGAVALARHLAGRGMSIAGVITGGTGVVLTVMLTIVWFGVFGVYGQADRHDPGAATPATPPPATPPLDDGEFHAARQSGPAPFGSAVGYDDGVSVSVSAGIPYTPQDPTWSTQPFDREYAVTVTNSGSDDLDVDIIGRASAGGTRADPILDEDLDTLKKRELGPGQSGTYRIAFSLASDDDVLVQVSIDDDYGYARFGD